MKKWGRQPHATPAKPVSATVSRSIKRFSEARRNVIRGAVADARRGTIETEKINAIRNNATENDMVAAATLLESPKGLRQRRVEGLLQSDIPLGHNLRPRTAALEVAYACGFLNAWKSESLMAIRTIAVLSGLTDVSVKDAIGALSATAAKWGASNYLSLKLAYIEEFLVLDDNDHLALDEIEKIIGNIENPAVRYSALENLKPRLSLFLLARRYTNILMDHIKGDFRRFHTLDNLIATPISADDCGGFVLRSVESSLVDTVRCIWIILNLSERFPDLVSTIQRTLDPDIFNLLAQSRAALVNRPPPQLLTPVDDIIGIGEDEERYIDEDRSLSLYRRSLVFLEFPTLCTFRHDIDRVIGHRLIAPLLPEIGAWHGDNFYRLDVLRQPNGVFELDKHGQTDLRIDTFYRTYLFLSFIQNPTNLAQLSSDDVRYIFENTTRLEFLLLERELKTMHINASDDARALIAILALSLYRSKSSDPDVDFDFREKLEDYIISSFAGIIPDFIESLAPASPAIANYVASSLDEVTLQKMYRLIDSPLSAENARREILTIVGVHLNKIEYIIEAEAIETRSKVAKVKNYFDASRMFVDSVAMKKWMSSNPSAYAEQYKELLPRITARFSTSKSIVSSSGRETTIEVLEITSTDTYLVERMAMEAFREFCVNNEFGIESYLGRRIRHNTLQGVMTKSVDAVLQKSEYSAIISGTPFGNALRSWESNYKIFIERMRKEFLQFRSDGRPNALFNSDIDPSETVTRRNLQQLVQTLRLSGAEMLDELIITFCWQQIAPQLEAASRQIRVKMTQEMTQHLGQALQRFNGPEELKIKSALEDGITSVFAQVASWFQVPQTGFVPASIPEICNIIDIEHGRSSTPTIVSGSDLSTSYYGISVHRLYDCLAVLLQNAFKHGRPGTDVTVKMSSEPTQASNLHILSVAVQSTLPNDGASRCIGRVGAALTSSETGRDMVTEGYSGIKKVKFITRLNEGFSTVTFDVNDDLIEVIFRLRVEVASKEGGY